MARPKEEIQTEIDDLLELDSWGEKETEHFKKLIREHPKKTEEDQKYIAWMQEAAFLLQA